MKTTDRARITDAPLLNGFFADGRFYPYVMGGAPDGEGENSGAASGGEGEGEGDGGNSGDKDDANQNSTEGEGSDGEKKFTQEEVNALIAKETSKAQRGKIDPKELGFESAKEMQAFLDEQKEKAEAQKTEAEKQLEEAIATAKQEATDSVLSQAHGVMLKAEFRVLARDAGIPTERLDDAFALAQIHEDWAEVKVEDDKVIGLNTDFFESLKEAKPYLFDEEEDQGPGNAGGAAKGQKQKKGSRDDELKTKYPALQQN
jgi:hypothetical protein